MRISKLIKGYYTDKDGFVSGCISGWSTPNNPFDFEEIISVRTKSRKIIRLLHTQVSFNQKDLLNVFEIAFADELMKRIVTPTHLKTYVEWPWIKGCLLKKGGDGYYIVLDKFVFQTDAQTLTLDYLPEDFVKVSKPPIIVSRSVSKAIDRLLPYWNQDIPMRKVIALSHVSFRTIKKIIDNELLPERGA
jgi:hypothetical protein